MRVSIVGSIVTAIFVTAAVPLLIHAQQPEGKSPASLVVYPNGENVRYYEQSGAWQVHYDVQAQYPAEEVLHYIRSGLARQGWEPLNEDVLNPGQPSSHLTGWQDFVDGRTSPKMQVRQWLAQWKNAQGDVVWYRLQYRYPKGTSPIPRSVSVTGNYYPASIVEEQLKSVQEERRKRNR